MNPDGPESEQNDSHPAIRSSLFVYVKRFLQIAAFLILVLFIVGIASCREELRHVFCDSGPRLAGDSLHPPRLRPIHLALGSPLLLVPPTPQLIGEGVMVLENEQGKVPLKLVRRRETSGGSEGSQCTATGGCTCACVGQNCSSAACMGCSTTTKYRGVKVRYGVARYSDELRLNLRYPGQYQDTESAMSYNWHRYYHPLLGNYLQEEPLLTRPEYIGSAGADGLSMSPYAYVEGNPIVLSDPTGENPIAGAAAGTVVCGPVCTVVGAVVGLTAAGVAGYCAAKAREMCVLIGSGGTKHPGKNLRCTYLCSSGQKEMHTHSNECPSTYLF